MKKDNPYSLMFGKQPTQMISRYVQSDEILQSFTSDIPSQQIYLITGVRGSGKTVLMTDISRRIQELDNWIVVELNPAGDLLTSLAAKLYNNQKLSLAFKKAKIDLSFFGIGIEIDKASPITDMETAVERMLSEINKQGKRVLITVDEVASTKEIKIFTSAFQIFVRKDLPVYLLMTGLYDNIESLQNDKVLTFLHRAPKVRLRPLDFGAIADHYQSTFRLNKGTAQEMARVTRGYSFAFQVLGYFTFENGGSYKNALLQSKQYLAEYVYDILWSELFETDRRVARAIAQAESGKVSEIRDIAQMKSNELSPYRDRLIKKGLLNGDQYGKLQFALPFFEDYVLEHSEASAE